MMRLNLEKDLWKAGLYVDKFFEDHSAMFQLDYDGYGSGEEWQVKKKRRYVLYDFKDWMIGFDLNMKYGTWLRNIVVEYIYTNIKADLYTTTIRRLFPTISAAPTITTTTTSILDGSTGDR